MFKKLSKTAWIAIGVGVFVIAFAALYMLYSQQQSQKQQLESDLVTAQNRTVIIVTDKSNAEANLTKLQKDLSSLESELSTVKLQLDSSMSGFPESVESIEYDEKFFFIADNWGLDVLDITSTEPKDEMIGDVTFTVATFTVTVKGQVDDILGFVSNVSIDDYFINGTIDKVELTVPKELSAGEMEEMTEEEIAEEEEARTPSAVLALTIYGY